MKKILLISLIVFITIGCGGTASLSPPTPTAQVVEEPATQLLDSSNECGGKEYNPKTQFCDFRDKKLYKFVTIGKQIWMAENLNYAVEGSKCGGVIPKTVEDCYKEECEKVTLYSLEDENTENCNIYGRLYNWATAMKLDTVCNSISCVSHISAKHKGICPNDWHLPDKDEWDTLVTAVGGNAIAGTKLKAKSGWGWSEWGNIYGNGTDDYGFSALPGGFGIHSGWFLEVGISGAWWNANEDHSPLSPIAYYRSMESLEHWSIGRSSGHKSILKSIRCVKDSAH